MSIDENLIARQVSLEEEMRSSGVARYWSRVEKARQARDESTTKPGVQLLDTQLLKMIEAVKGFFNDAASGKPGRRHVAYQFVKDVKPELLAFLTLKVALDNVSRLQSAQSAAVAIGRAVHDEICFIQFEKQQPVLWRAILNTLEMENSGSNERRARLKRSAGRYEIDFPDWAEDQRYHVGMKMIDLLIESTGLFEIVTYDEKVGRKKTLLKPTKDTMEWIVDCHRHCELLSPVYLPMLVPPVDWSTPRDGGYLTNAVRRTPLVKTRNRNYLIDLGNVDMPQVYGAVNAIQRTAWQINGPVLEVAKAIWESGSGIAGFAAYQELELPPFPETKEDPGRIQAWKKAAMVIHQLNNKNRSRKIATAKALWVAEKFRDEAEIFFPHYLDFRGRIYPRPLFLNPQGPDHCKGLLRFAEGKPLGERGAAWLAVHLANLWGYDKVDLEDRIAWTLEHSSRIEACANDPLGDKWWAEADKPFCFLAACLEWAGYLQEGEAFISHLPIALDGTCNGLQNFSMMLRDPIGGAAVNLVPADKPQDIYQRVADVVMGKLRLQSCTCETEGAEMAGRWLRSGLVDRKLCKKPVMTLPYGAKAFGMRSGIADYLRDALGEQPIPSFTSDELFPATVFIGNIIWDAIGEVVVAARQAMDFLQKVSQVASAEGMPIFWTTPAGFPVLQEYKEEIGKQVKTQLGGQLLKLTLAREGSKLDRRRQASGVSPNFVHSMDASHLMKTVWLASCNEVTSFAMIHDSYGTHACDTDVLGQALRETFVEQYREDVLGNFRKEVIEQLLPETAALIPGLPQTGSLDPEAVLESPFFFS